MAQSPTDEQVETPTEEKPVETPQIETSEPDSSTEDETDLSEAPEASETPEKAEEPSEDTELTDKERKSLSVKAQRRFSDLSKKAKRAEELEEEIETLRKSQEEGFVAGAMPDTGAVSPETQAPPRLPWETDLEKGEAQQITREGYKRDVLTTADWLVKARIGQVEKANEIKSDLNSIQKKYEALNPESETYDKGLSSKLAGLFATQLKANPNAKLSEFVGAVMDVRKAGEEEGVSKATATLAEQKAEEALTPSEAGSEAMAPEKFEDLSLAEQEKYLKEHGMWE